MKRVEVTPTVHDARRFRWRVTLWGKVFIETETKTQARQVARDSRSYFPANEADMSEAQKVAGLTMREHAAFAQAGTEMPTLAECEAHGLARIAASTTCEFCGLTHGNHYMDCPMYDEKEEA